MKKFCFLLVAMCFFNFSFSQSSNNIYDGVWVGKGYQLDANDSWSIKIKIQGDKFNISYPSLNCSGILILEKTEGNKLYFTEKIKTGDCVNNGKLILELINPDELRFKWSYTNGEPGSFATLIRF